MICDYGISDQHHQYYHSAFRIRVNKPRLSERRKVGGMSRYEDSERHWAVMRFPWQSLYSTVQYSTVQYSDEVPMAVSAASAECRVCLLMALL